MSTRRHARALSPRAAAVGDGAAAPPAEGQRDAGGLRSPSPIPLLSVCGVSLLRRRVNGSSRRWGGPFCAWPGSIPAGLRGSTHTRKHTNEGHNQSVEAASCAVYARRGALGVRCRFSRPFGAARQSREQWGSQHAACTPGRVLAGSAESLAPSVRRSPPRCLGGRPRTHASSHAPPAALHSSAPLPPSSLPAAVHERVLLPRSAHSVQAASLWIHSAQRVGRRLAAAQPDQEARRLRRSAPSHGHHGEPTRIAGKSESRRSAGKAGGHSRAGDVTERRTHTDGAGEPGQSGARPVVGPLVSPSSAVSSATAAVTCARCSAGSNARSWSSGQRRICCREPTPESAEAGDRRANRSSRSGRRTATVAFVRRAAQTHARAASRRQVQGR